MNIKSLLIGSASAAVLSTSALAADAIVYADPEPMEYVRICDVYGAGYYYIPGTETCLKIGGYVRFQWQSPAGAVTSNPAFDGYGTYARFVPHFDARTQTEWGTLRSFGEVRFQYDTTAAGPAVTSNAIIEHAFIDIGDRNFLRVGYNWRPHGVWIGAGGNVEDGQYGRGGANQIAYYFNHTQPNGSGTAAPGKTGISGFISVLDNPADDSWSTNIEAGVGYGWGSGRVAVSAAYDSIMTGLAYDVGTGFSAASGSAWSIKAGIEQAFTPTITARLAVLYNSRPDVLAGGQVYGLGWQSASYSSQWSVLAGADFKFSPKAALNLTVQWWDRNERNSPANLNLWNNNWYAAVGVNWQPVSGLSVRPEVNYIKSYDHGSAWGGRLRIQRSF